MKTAKLRLTLPVDLLERLEQTKQGRSISETATELLTKTLSANGAINDDKTKQRI